MSGITQLLIAVTCHEAVSVQANLRSKLCRSQNRRLPEGLTSMSGITQLLIAATCHEAVSVQANLRSKLCRSQNRRLQKGLPA